MTFRVYIFFFAIFNSIKLFNSLHTIDPISVKTAASIVGVDNEDSKIFEGLMKFCKATLRHNPENSSL